MGATAEIPARPDARPEVLGSVHDRYFGGRKPGSG
jgi:hypothetical protein